MTVIRRLMSDDRPMLDAFLECHRASSMFLRSNLFYSGLIDGPDRFHGLYMGAFKGGALTDVAAHYWNNNIILQAPTMPMELACAVAKESGRNVNGVLGPWAQVKAAEPGLDLDRTRLGKVVPEYLYLLSLDEMVVPESLSSEAVTHRRAGPHDLDTLVAWRRVYDRITMGFPEHTIDDERNRAMLSSTIDDARLWVLLDGDTPVAMTGFNAAMPDTVQVGGVFTPEDQRGRGHARSVVAGALLDAKVDRAVEAILFTEMDNSPAQKAYESLGFEQVGDYGMVVVDPSTSDVKKKETQP